MENSAEYNNRTNLKLGILKNLPLHCYIQMKIIRFKDIQACYDISMIVFGFVSQIRRLNKRTFHPLPVKDVQCSQIITVLSLLLI